MSNNHRKAVIVVHGMGNQIPLTSIREFVENVNSGGSQLYSSPDRIVGDLETRRFSYHNRSHDYYELYWAHLVEEPSMFEVVSWSLKLLLCKKPSARAFTAVICVRIIITVLMILMGYLAFNFEDFMGFFQSSHGIVASGVLVFIVYKLLYPALKTMFSTALLQSIGDVVKYTVPSPKNINVRNKIRQKGLEMLKKLHEAKDTSGDYIYDDIVVVGHSLGSIVCYDLLTFLFPEYNTSSIVKSKYDQDNIKAFAELVSNNPDLSSQEYQ